MGKENNSGTNSPAISLPKGGGAITGIGETFQPNLFSGTGNFSIPIYTSPGRNGFGPKLTLQYSTGNGNGVFGLGWQLSIPQITRKTEKGLPKYTDQDVFVMSGAEDLVPVLDTTGDPLVLPDRDGYSIRRYRPRTEGLFARIEKWTNNTDPTDVYWVVTTRENITSMYGKTASARIVDPAPKKEDHIYQWLLEETFDAKGNHIYYEYVQENPRQAIRKIYEQNRTYTQAYLRRILYGNVPKSLLPEKKVGPKKRATDHKKLTRKIWRHYLFEVLFDYKDLPPTPEVPFDPVTFPEKTNPSEWPVREDPFSHFRSRFEIRTLRRCERVLMLHHFDEGELAGAPLVKSTDFEYTINKDTKLSMLSAVKTTGYRKKFLFEADWAVMQNGLEAETATDDLIQEFDRHGVSLTANASVETRTPDRVWQIKEADLACLIEKRDTLLHIYECAYLSAEMPPVTFKYSEFKPKEQRFESVKARGNDLPPKALNNPDFSLIDLFGDGIPDVLNATDFGYHYWQNLGNAHIDRRHPQHGAVPAGITLSDLNVAVGDMGGDGLPDLIVDSSTMSGFYEATPEGRWKPFKRFDAFPNTSLADPSARLLDLTGDGLSDILITHDHHFLWYQCKGEKGYTEPGIIERRHNLDEFPDVYFNDPAGRVRLADMTGDGLNDIVLVHNGRIEYWPNLGYGDFGKRITMKSAPKLEINFDPKRLFLVDIDGTGCADLVYVDFGKVDFCFNQSGNSWSDKQSINGTPPVFDLSAVQFADFFGTGTATLVWSYDYNFQTGSNYKVLDFCGGEKPHLLIEMSNNMGATTRIQYASSTKFYLEDMEKGTPWVTNLPFPVQVLEKTEVIDHISKTKLVTTYKYHHGYYDGREREFRGFGRVDQFDTETFIEFSKSGLHEGNNLFENNNAAYHVPPIETRTWFHTGIYFDEDKPNKSSVFFDHHTLLEKYQEEFYISDPHAFVMDDQEFVAFPTSTPTETPDEIFRALRSIVLRTETYAMGESTRANHPYHVTQFRYQINELQEKGNNPNAVYLTTQKEKITYHYERTPRDPRIGHEITLNVDEFGNVTDKVSIGYPRRIVPGDMPEQGFLRVLYTKTDFINKADDPKLYFTGIPCQMRSFEITGLGSNRKLNETDFQPIIDDLKPLQADLTKFKPYLWERNSSATGIKKRIVEWRREYFRKDENPDKIDTPARLTYRLDLGEIESLSLPFESYSAAFTETMLTEIYGNRTANIDLAKEGGYLNKESDAPEYWWLPFGRKSFNEDKFFVSEELQDPFGNKTYLTFDEYALLLRTVKDSLNNVIDAEIDYRVLQPFKIKDPNDNYSQTAFDSLGMVVATAVMGKDGEKQGDLLEGFDPDPPPASLQAFVSDPQGHALNMLGKATTRFVYNLDHYQRAGKPPFAAALARETHYQVLDGSQTKIQISFSYSDGFGREIQKKIQAEPGIVPKRDVDGKIIVDANNQPEMTSNIVNTRWVGSGWTVYNNKGKPVRQYEPFFTDTHNFEFNVTTGVSQVLFYDPLERVVATLHSNHTYEKVVFDPWKQTAYDVNDTVTASDGQTGEPRTDPDIADYLKAYFKTQPDTWETWYAQRQSGSLGLQEQAAAIKAATHADTPTKEYFDVLGRPFLTVAHNKVVCPNHDLDGTEDMLHTRVELDIEDNRRAVRDAIQEFVDEHGNGVIDKLGRIVIRYDYDMLSNLIHQASMEAGERWMLNDVSGNPIRSWGGRGFTHRMTYDKLRRPTGLYVTENGIERLAEKTIYGESQGNSANQRTRVYQMHDGAGIITNVSFDFKGNLEESRRDLLPTYKQAVDWLQNPATNDGSFTSHTTYDALNRQHTRTSPDGSVHRLTYNEANLLDRIIVNLRGAAVVTPFITNIDYNAKGQRQRIVYGNGISTFYDYDPLTYRLVKILTIRGKKDASDCSPVLDPRSCEDPPAICSRLSSNKCILQNLHYTYDPAGNITHIRDDVQQTIYFKNKRVEPSFEYTYDAVYRLIEARGREHLKRAGGMPLPPSHNDAPKVGLLHPGDGRAMGRYLEHYVYDGMGNFEETRHIGTDPAHPGWTRSYAYEETSLIEGRKKSNRLSNTTIGSDSPEAYSYDAHGNMVHMPHLSRMQWNFEDQLQATSRQNVGDSDCTPETTYYVYDTDGQRVRKVTERYAPPGLTPSRREERVYLDGFEIYRKYEANGSTCRLERETLHIKVKEQSIALVETKTVENGNQVNTPIPLQRYQLGNHLSSASIELDNEARIISYEEYYPYGGTSYQAGHSVTEVNIKRYKYTGKEREKESGLYFYGARYYIPWLGRWSIPDLIGIADGLNLYIFTRGNPVTFMDKGGLASKRGTNDNTVPSEINKNWSRIEPKPLLSFEVKEFVQYSKMDFVLNDFPPTPVQFILGEILPMETNISEAVPSPSSSKQPDISERIPSPEKEQDLFDRIPHPSQESKSHEGIPLSTKVQKLPELVTNPIRGPKPRERFHNIIKIPDLPKLVKLPKNEPSSSKKYSHPIKEPELPELVSIPGKYRRRTPCEISKMKCAESIVGPIWDRIRDIFVHPELKDPSKARTNNCVIGPRG